MPLRYNKQGRVLKLNRILYGLRQSFLLWQQNLINEIKRLDFKKIPQELCVVQKDDIICFFYINDIIFVFKKD